MVDVTVAYTTTDNCGIPVCSLSATSSEPDDGGGDGSTTGDIKSSMRTTCACGPNAPAEGPAAATR